MQRFYATSMFEALTFPSTNLAFDFGARDDLVEGEEDLGEEVDLFFLRFGFFGILGRSVGGMSANLSDDGFRPSVSPKSVTIGHKRKKEIISQVLYNVVKLFNYLTI